MAVLGCSRERGGDGSGGEREGAGAEGERGGEWEVGSRRRGRGSLILPGEVVGRERAPVPTRVGGTGKGGGRGRRAGSAGWARWQGLWLAGPFGPGGRVPFVFSLLFLFCLNLFKSI